MFYALVSTIYDGVPVRKVYGCGRKSERDQLVSHINDSAERHGLFEKHGGKIWHGRWDMHDSAQAITARDARKLMRGRSEFDFWTYQGMTVCDV